MADERADKHRRTPTQERSRFTVEQILLAAAQIFEERGYSGGTTNHIAARAGVSVGTLYQYFPNKDAILTELSMRHMRQAGSTLRAFLEAHPTSPEGLVPFLEDLFRATLEQHTVAPRLHQVLFDEAPWPPALRQAMSETLGRMTDEVAEALQRMPGLHVPHPRVTAWLLVTTSESLAHQYVLEGPSDMDEEVFVGEVVQLLGSYLTTVRP